MLAYDTSQMHYCMSVMLLCFERLNECSSGQLAGLEGVVLEQSSFLLTKKDNVEGVSSRNPLLPSGRFNCSAASSKQGLVHRVNDTFPESFCSTQDGQRIDIEIDSIVSERLSKTNSAGIRRERRKLNAA